MGSSCPVTIHFTSKLKSCFVNVSTLLEREWNSIWKDVSVVKGIRLVCEDKSIYTSWSGHTYISSQDSHAIQISRKFGEGLGLKDGQEVVATPLGNVASCTHATFLPTSKSDWEIAESNSNVIESNLTNQLRIIWEGAILPIWIQKNNCLVVTVGEIYPQNSYAQIEEFTELKLVPWEQVQSTKDKPSEELTPTDQNCVESSSVSTASSSPIDISTDGNKSDSTSSSQSTSSSRVRNSFNLSFGRSLNEVGDKYEQTYTPTYPVDISNSLPGFRGGVVNLMKAVVYGTHSAEVGNSEKSLKYPTTNKSYFQGGKVSNTSVMRGKKSSSTLFSGIPMDSYYRVQDLLVPSNDVATPHMKRGRTQLLLRKLFEQPSTVFVYCAALTWFVNRLLNDKVPIADDVLISNKYAVVTVSIRKMYSVKERFDVNSSGKRADTGSNDNTPTDDLKESDPVKLFERKRFESSMNSKQRNVSSGERGSFASLPATTVRLVLTNQRNFYVDEDSKDCLLLGEELVPGHVAVNGLLRRQLKLGIKSTIQIKRVFHKPSFLMGIVLNPFGDSARKIKFFSKNEVSYAFRIWILDTTKEYPLVLSSRMLIAFNLSPDVKCEFLLSGIGTDSPNSNPSNMQYYFVSQETLKDVRITVGEVIQPSYYLLLSPYPPKNTLMLDQELPKCRISSLGGFDQIYKTCFDFLLHGLSCQPLSQELSRSGKLGCHALLLHGSGSTAGGSGKSSLARALCNQLGRHPILAYVSIIECISLRGKRVETIRQSWQQVFSNSAWHQPAVVLFDDLDQLIAAPSLLQEHGPEAHYSLRLAEVFKDLLRKEATYNSQLVVIATVTSRDSVHPSLLTSHGNHVFNKTVEVPLPGLNERALMINSILRRKEMCLPSEDVRFIAVKTEGCSPKDLNTLVARAFQVTTMRRNRSKQDLDSPTISLHDFREAFKNFKPASLHGIKLHQAVDLGWQDVGGLEEVKRTLRETLEWPVKFPKLYTNIPMRLPSGILLYGPPGTGKTLLAGVVAKECSLNFISIKGPELLNKYIGASEQAVRDLFHRAQSAKPCILFFDEFDSMAPSRGHDSTGVTDRVVNQLLTQLDGVEGLEGVYILGATSRPDLIDPALLRPGRLDKSLYCGMPDEKDRLDILKALSSKLNLHDDVDLEGIARETVNFSGADLKALLSNAQLESIHEMTSTIPGKSDKAKRSSNIVCMPQLKDGPRELPVEENKELQKQVGVLEENFFKHLSGKANDSPQPDMSHTVTIKHSNIMKSLSNMGPSVSSEERIKYASIYNSFMKSRKTASPQMSVIKQRATLA